MFSAAYRETRARHRDDLFLKFCRGPHIDDLPLLKRLRWLEVGKVNPLLSFGRQSGSLRFLGGDPAEDVIEADAIKLPHGEIDVFRLLQHQQNRIALREIGAGGSGEKRRPQRRVNSPRDVRRVEDFPIVSRIENPDSLAAGCAGKLRSIEARRFGTPPVTAMPSRFTRFIVAK